MAVCIRCTLQLIFSHLCCTLCYSILSFTIASCAWFCSCFTIQSSLCGSSILLPLLELPWIRCVAFLGQDNIFSLSNRVYHYSLSIFGTRWCQPYSLCSEFLLWLDPFKRSDFWRSILHGWDVIEIGIS